MAAILEALRQDPTSRFFGVPRDLTRLLRALLRPLDSSLSQITMKRNCRGLGLTLDDRLIIQFGDVCQTQIVSLPDLTLVQTLTLPPCRRIWALHNGEFFCQLDDSRFQYQDQMYSFTLRATKIYLVLTSALTEPGLNFLADWGDQVEVTPEGKIYLSHQNRMYEHNFFSAGPARWLFSVPLGRYVMAVSSEKLYISLTNRLLIFHVESTALEFGPTCRSLDPGYAEVQIEFSNLIVDPATNFLYGYWPGEHMRKLRPDLPRGHGHWVSRSGYLVVWDDDLAIYG